MHSLLYECLISHNKESVPIVIEYIKIRNCLEKRGRFLSRKEKASFDTMDASFLKIGQKICLISKANVRYEGILVKINTETLNIMLSEVRIYGAEDCAANSYIPIYPYLYFESEYISEIHFVAKLPAPVEQVKVVARRDYPQSAFPLQRYASVLKIGQKISLITKMNWRCEGILVKIETETFKIILSDVRIYGTEDRAANLYIPIQEAIYPYLYFDSKQISEIHYFQKLTPPAEHVKVVVRRLQSASRVSSLQQSPRLDMTANTRMWRIARVHSFSGHSGHPNVLPTNIDEESLTSAAEGENKKENEDFGISFQTVKTVWKIVHTQGAIPKKHATSHTTASKQNTTPTATTND